AAVKQLVGDDGRDLDPQNGVQEVAGSNPVAQTCKACLYKKLRQAFLLTFSGPGTLWARTEPETASELRGPATTCSFTAYRRSNSFVPQDPIAPPLVMGSQA